MKNKKAVCMSASQNCNELIALLKKVTADVKRSPSFWEAFEQPENLDVNGFMTLSAAAPRRLGRKSIDWSPEDAALLDKINPALQLKPPGFIGRFLLAATIATPDWLKEMITRGGDEEQAAAILALNEREDAEDFKDNVVHACRTNSVDVFSAVSQDNPYPATHFSDPEFKQLTIKTIFMGLNFNKIQGLEERFCGDLGNSLIDFFDERRAAGRWLPDEVLEFMEKKGLLK